MFAAPNNTYLFTTYMAVKIRLRRGGRKAAPFYTLVVADARSPRDGRFIQKIGFYNPVTVPAQIHVDVAAAIEWLDNGAQPTNTARNILRNAGVTLRHALKKQGKSDDIAQRIVDRWFATKMASPKRNFILVDKEGKPLPGQPELVKAAKPDLKQIKVKPVVEEAAPEAEEVAAEEAAAPEAEA